MQFIFTKSRQSRRTPTTSPREQHSSLKSVLSSDSYNRQTACLLFTRLPTELRLDIYEFLFTEYDHLSNPYNKTDFFYRPTHRYARRIHTAFLQTCRLAYIETHLLPLSLNDHTFFLYREPPDRKFRTRVDFFFKSLTPTQASAVRSVHLYTQQFWLEGSHIHTWPLLTNICTPRKLTITIRHTDWWYWESGQSLGIDPRLSGRAYSHDMLPPAKYVSYHFGWGQFFRYFRGLEEVFIELETEQGKKAELDLIVDHFTWAWYFPAYDGRIFVKDETATKRYTWIGSNIFRPPFTHPNGPYVSGSVANVPSTSAESADPQSTNKPGPDEMIMHVVVMKWTPQTPPQES